MPYIWDRTKYYMRRVLYQMSLPPLRRWLRSRTEGPDDIPPVGLVRFGSLRRLNPISRRWGEDRGGPLDRYYIENFLRENGADIRGRVMEIAEDVYSRWFGGNRVARVDILAYREGEHPNAAFIGDLTSADHIPSDAFDCVIVTQTLQLIYDVRSAVRTMHRILKPGGVVLVTVPGISQTNRHDAVPWGDYWCWNFTPLSARMLFEEYFPAENVDIGVHGNVLVAASFLYGLGREELTRSELDYLDPDYPVLITVRAQKGTVSS